ncbi:MAG TPA: SIR2 family protein, partial [Anaerolineae bacterium]|nr:SIR2 family protein [Anaerolineae bacterium]
MDLEAAMEYALRGDAVLFTGAGFSLGAKNVKGQPLKTGWQLATYLATEAGIPEQTRLEDAAESFVEEFGEDRLIDLLREEFTVQTVEAYHRVIASIPWKRIYTTNYDDVLEKASNQEGMAVTTVSLSDKSQYIPTTNRICMHLNGCINRLDRETISSEIKLTDVSYLTASIVESPWSAFFRQDLRLARAVFFVGYSLADLDIKRIIYDFDDLKTKCFFVLGLNPDGPTLRRASRFGFVLNQVDTHGFASHLLQKRGSYALVEPLPLEHYCYGKVNVGDRGADFSDSSLIDLLALGDFQQEFVRRSIYEELPYFCERTESSRVVDFLKGTGRAIVVHSDLGNGKTLFVEGIQYRAVEQGFDVYELQRRSEDIYRETEQILHSETPHLIIIENYHDWFDVLDLISMHWNHKTKIVLTARSSIHDVTIDGLLRSLKISSIPEFSLDNLDDRDVTWLVNLFDLYGLWGDKAA